MSTVSVVVPVRDDSAHLRRLLTALAGQSRVPDEIVVVDNGSTDDSAMVARAAGAVVIEVPVQGIARASAAGYDRSAGDVIVRLDADSVPPPRWIEHAVDLLADPAVVAVTGPGRPRQHADADGDAARHGVLRGAALRDAVLRGIWDTLYMGPYFVLMWSALGRPPLFGSAMAMPRATWERVQHRVHRTDAEVHDDVDLSMQLDPAWRVLVDPALALEVSARPLASFSSALTRTRRAFHTFRVNGRRANPVRRWARRYRVAARTRSAGRWSIR
ncbi:glycosyltransferase family 2 protein [Curtobacterium sp. ISL-83]|uniref:glycosyltransferase family 2 protein n=1 Tax=Curtobacterium sp. ISL-83 TaxID=2819145 RepID=UPI001BE9E097|nr:glycosyltransferase family 2 protein [Curtobacterium sp. ISL-83]MBT2502488.1 glycosyltransferase family 2 protein [Curtobacterium sp. ISL-83]